MASVRPTPSQCFYRRAARRNAAALRSAAAGVVVEEIEQRVMMSVTLSPPGTVNEGSPYTLAISGATNPVDIDWGDGNVDSGVTTPTFDHTYVDGSSGGTVYPITVTTQGAAAHDGDPDPSFGTSGTVDLGPRVAPDPNTHAGSNEIILPEGNKIVVADSIPKIPASGGNPAQPPLVVVRRFNEDGSLDTTFGTGGTTVVNWNATGSDDEVRVAGLAITPDNKLLLAGSVASYSNFLGSWIGDVGLARFDLDGNPDTTFTGGNKFGNSAGAIRQRFGTEFVTASSLAVDADGNVVVAGYTDSQAALVRFVPNTPVLSTDPTIVTDAGFGNGGLVETSVLGGTAAYGVSFEGSGAGEQILVAGTARNNSAFTVLRYNPNGQLDSSFGTGGYVALPGANDTGTAGLSVAQAFGVKAVGGQIFAVGNGWNIFSSGGGTTSQGIAFVRLSDTGGWDGTYSFIPTGYRNAGPGAAVFTADKVVVGATFNDPTGHPTNGDDMFIGRFGLDGTIDSTFGTNGLVSRQLPGSLDQVHSMAIDANGRLLVAGHTGPANGNGILFRYAATQSSQVTTVTTSVTVNNVAPTPVIQVGAGSYTEGTPIDVGTFASDPGSIDSPTVAWTVTSGSTTIASGSGNVAFTPADNGDYLVTLTATDKDGATGTSSSTIHVDNVAPGVSLGAPSDPQVEGVAIALTGSVSDVAADLPVASTTWTVTKDGNPSPFASGTGTAIDFTPDDNGTYVVTLAATDKDGGTGSAFESIDVANVPPVVALGALPASSPEGTRITATGSATDVPADQPTLQTTWSVTKGGQPYASGTGAIDFTPDDNATYVVTYTATDKDGGTASESKTVTVTNVAPTVTASGSIVGVRGQDLTLSASFTDPGILDTHTAVWTFDDGTTAAGTVDEAAHTVTVTHSFATEGTHYATVLVTDKDGGTGSASVTVNTYILLLVPSPVVPGQTDLLVGGTPGNDRIVVNPGGAGAVQVIVNGQRFDGYSPTGHVVVYGYAGDDSLQIAGGVTVPAEVYGGDGNDTIKGGNIANILVGGAGNDQILGGNARDLIIGGAGADSINGNAQDDVLVASSTIYDGSRSSLNAIMAEWTSTNSYATRVLHLTLGSTGAGDIALNGDVKLNNAALDDDHAVDSLTGGSGSDLFVLDFGSDHITDLGFGDFAYDPDLIL